MLRDTTTTTTFREERERKRRNRTQRPTPFDNTKGRTSLGFFPFFGGGAGEGELRARAPRQTHSHTTTSPRAAYIATHSPTGKQRQDTNLNVPIATRPSVIWGRSGTHSHSKTQLLLSRIAIKTNTRTQRPTHFDNEMAYVAGFFPFFTSLKALPQRF